MGIVSEIVPTSLLSEPDVRDMFALMRMYFDGVREDIFQRDLFEKEWVALLRDASTTEICGFSTIAVLKDVVDGQINKAVYSGDTIVRKEHRQAFSLETVWIPFVFSLVQAEPDIDWYWFLVCKGYRTYRYLPVHFKRFWPSPDDSVPPREKRILDRFALKKFGDFYFPESYTIKCPEDYRLKKGVSDITPAKRKNRYVDFFVQSNPGWYRGDELACIVPLSLGNIKSTLRRILSSHSTFTP